MGILDELREKVRLDEESLVLEKLLVEMHFFGNTTTKHLSRRTFLPVPLVAAIKKEMVKAGLLKQSHKIEVTEQGKNLVEKELGYRQLDHKFFRALATGTYDFKQWEKDFPELESIFANRPGVDVTLDQSKCTPETALRRAVLAIGQYMLVGKKVLCIGDDDLISISCGLLLKKLFRGGTGKSNLEVVDIDTRFLDYITETAFRFELPVSCHKHDLRNPLPRQLQGVCACAFTDPPYTIPGMTLFITRALEGLEKRKDRMVFLSFPHKPSDFMLTVYKQITAMGLVPETVLPRFNQYEGAEIIGNLSQMIILKTTSFTHTTMEGEFCDPFYTGELRKTVRLYQCKGCGKKTRVGQTETYRTIEQLKEVRCQVCGGESFERLSRQ